jgi:transposase
MMSNLPPVVVGIDVAKDSFAVAIRRLEAAEPHLRGDFLATSSFPVRQEGFKGLQALLEEHGAFPQDFAVALESSGPYTLPVLAWLVNRGLRTYLVNPLMVYRFRRSQSLRATKTDEIDARTIALFLLQTQHLPDPIQDTDDTFILAREYERLSQQVARVKTQIRQLVHGLFPELASYRGLFSHYLLTMLLQFPSARAMRQAPSRRLKKAFAQALSSRGKSPALSWHDLQRLARRSVGAHSPARETILQSKTRQLRTLLDERDRVRQALIEAVQQNDPDAWNSTTSVPGIGDTTSALFLAQIRSVDRFDTVKQLTAFAGIDPTANQSGQYVAPSHISKRGSPHLRRTLFLMAQSVIRYCATFRDYFLRLRERGKAYRVAVIATAHKLLNVLFTLLKNHTTFRANYDPSICDS